MEDVRFEHPWALLLLLLIPGILFLRERCRRTVAFSGGEWIGHGLGPGPWKRYGPDVLGVVFLVASVLAVANLQYASYWEKSYLESRWIMIVQDLSGSMGRPAGDERGSTLGDVALEGVESFIGMRGKEDLIGLIAFSSYAKLVAPPTFDKEILKRKLFLLSRRSDSVIHRELSAGGATNASYAAWLALCVFFALLPEEAQLSTEELDRLRYSLLGRTLRRVEVPEKLRRARFGHGMAIVLFTDGRIEANKSQEDVRRGLPNFVNVVKLIRRLGVRLYLIVVGGDVREEVKAAMEAPGAEGGEVGRIFYMPRTFRREKIEEVYRSIHSLEKNRLLTKISRRRRDTRRAFSWIAWGALLAYGFLRFSAGSRTL